MAEARERGVDGYSATLSGGAVNREICGIGRCRSEPDFGRIWSVPICNEHWERCCHEDIASLRWLHKHAKREFAEKLPPFVPHIPAEQVAKDPVRVVRRPVPPPVASVPRRVVHKPVRIPKLPIKIPKP